MTPMASGSGLPSPINAPLTHTLKVGEAVSIASGSLINIQLIPPASDDAPKSDLNAAGVSVPVRNSTPLSGGLAAFAVSLKAAATARF
jgi:hypothetical protein